MKLVNPANKRKYEIIVVGSGLAGGSAAATLGELGYNVKVFLLPGFPAPCPFDRRARRINAAKNYQNDGDSVYRMFLLTPQKAAISAPAKATFIASPAPASKCRPVTYF